MRVLPEGLQSHLEAGSTTLCTCWIVRRTDDVVLGFTDHEKPLVIEDVECRASSGFQPTEAVSSLGLASDNQEIEGAISSEAISEQDLLAGRFDNATVEIWMVNWQALDQRVHLRTALLGEVTRDDHAFRSELRGLTSQLEQQRGRVFSRSCDAVLGDARCGVGLANETFSTTGSVVEVIDRRRLRCSGLAGFDKGWFAHGNLEWTSGNNMGLSMEISGSAPTEIDILLLWQAMPHAPAIGDAFTVTAGCDKSFATCKAKFSNSVNFRGFPHMPGSDFALGYPDAATDHDGGPLIV